MGLWCLLITPATHCPQFMASCLSALTAMCQSWLSAHLASTRHLTELTPLLGFRAKVEQRRKEAELQEPNICFKMTQQKTTGEKKASYSADLQH